MYSPISNLFSRHQSVIQLTLAKSPLYWTELSCHFWSQSPLISLTTALPGIENKIKCKLALDFVQVWNWKEEFAGKNGREEAANNIYSNLLCFFKVFDDIFMVYAKYEMLRILICNVREHKWNEISNEARFDTFLVF